MLCRFLLPILTCAATVAAESFETQIVGGVSSIPVKEGTLTAEPGHAAIIDRHARTGKHALHIKGGDNKAVLYTFAKPLENDTHVSFWMERWTARAPFSVQMIAVTAKGDVPLEKVEKMKVGGYHEHVELLLPAGTIALRLLSSTAAGGGVLVDDMRVDCGPMAVQHVSVVEPGAYPIMKRSAINPVLAYRVSTSGSDSPLHLQEIKLNISPAKDIQEVTIRSGNQEASNFRNSVVFGKGVPQADGSVTIACRGALKPGVNSLWVDVKPADGAAVGGEVSFTPQGIVIDGVNHTTNQPTVTQRVGYLVAQPGEDVGNQPNGAAPRFCRSFRIPGLIRTASGAMLGCFDARYHHAGDLCADIDVAVVRSEDGGQTWTLPEIGMDSGPGVDNGCGDPCIVQDAKTGRIWMQALACHFSGGASLWTSKTGFDFHSTGQWEMVYSDDDGKTWSKDHVNPTNSIKKEEWTTILAGPGNGIYTKSGAIVFPAQIWDRAANPRCMSTICYSSDGGKTWIYGNGVPHATSECQVVELEDGALMLNCRNEARQGNRIVYVTRDMGKTWQAHETNNNTLREPTCQASLVSVDSPKYGKLLLFSNPKSGQRNHMTIRLSTDGGKTWSEGVEYDTRGCAGYSCIAMVDENHVGIFYEYAYKTEKVDQPGIAFIRIPLAEVVEAAAADK